MQLGDLPDTVFWRKFQGYFSGLLQWSDMSALWQQLKASPEGWFVFDTLEHPPQNRVECDEFEAILDEIKRFTHKRHKRHKRHKHEYCGFIYVDDRESPAFIKIFDPRKMGSSCGCSDELILPRWILSREQPDALPEPEVKKKGFTGWLPDRFQAVESN